MTSRSSKPLTLVLEAPATEFPDDGYSLLSINGMLMDQIDGMRHPEDDAGTGIFEKESGNTFRLVEVKPSRSKRLTDEQWMEQHWSDGGWEGVLGNDPIDMQGKKFLMVKGQMLYSETNDTNGWDCEEYFEIESLEPVDRMPSKVRCPDCHGRREVAAGRCTCGGIDIGVGIMHEPGCGKEQCGRCEGEGEIDWPFGLEPDGSWHIPEIEWKVCGDGEEEWKEPLWYVHEGKRYDMDTLKEKRSGQG